MFKALRGVVNPNAEFIAAIDFGFKGKLAVSVYKYFEDYGFYQMVETHIESPGISSLSYLHWVGDYSLLFMNDNELAVQIDIDPYSLPSLEDCPDEVEHY